MNKGFILDGFPRGQKDAKEVFMEKIEKENPEKKDTEEAEGAEPEEP